jgi:YidC/Oxa1 family membrane protein insertase
MAFKNVFLCLQTKKGKFGKEIMNIWDMLIIDPMINALLGIYSFVGNFGIAIILFTLLIRLVTFPLTRSQIKGTTAMQDMQKSPEFLKLKKKYKDDKQKLQQAQMELYKEKGINPLGSCLPTLIQFPIIIGLYRAVIMALAVTPTQMLFGIDLFGIGGIPVLAIIVVITTFLQTRLMTPPSQPGEQGAQMTQMMNLYMPLLMGYLAFSFAAGLALYFVTSNLATIGSYAAMGRLNWDNLIPKRKGKAKDG